MNQHNRTKERQARGSTLTFIARKGICQMPGTGIGRQESVKPTCRSRKSGLRSSVPCSTKSIHEDDEEMNTALPSGRRSASNLTCSSGPLSIWPNALVGQQQSVCEQQPTSTFASRLLSGRALILGSVRRHRQEPPKPCPTAQPFSALAPFLSPTAGLLLLDSA
jgi:uncharacterized protein YecT (DUF1311 family)